MDEQLLQLAGQDRRVARTLAEASAAGIEADARAAAEDRATDRKIRADRERLRLRAERDQLGAFRAERRRQRQDTKREAKRARKAARRAALTARWTSTAEYVRGNSARVYSGAVYGMAVSGAVYGQIDAATIHGMPMAVGIVSAAAIEGTGLAMALTAQEQRMQGERALAARAMTWIATAGAVAINAAGHAIGDDADPVKAIGLSALSAIGITVWEIRSGARHRAALRERGMIPEPMERYGWRRWLTHPRSTVAAWALDVRTRVSPGAARLIEQAEAERAEREAAQRAERESRRREAAQDRARVIAERAALRAARRGESGPALVALVRLAQTGEPAQQPAIAPAAEPLDAQTRTFLDHVQAQASEARTRINHRMITGTVHRPAQPPAPLLARSEPTRAVTRSATGPSLTSAQTQPASRPATHPAPGHESAPAQPGRPQRFTREPAQTAPVSRPATQRTRAAEPVSGSPGSRSTADITVLEKAYRRLSQKLGREPSGAELAAETGLSKATANRHKNRLAETTK